jgi:hypothetical protein
MDRKASNLEIMNRISEYLSRHPNERFGQALVNLGIIVSCLDEDFARKVDDPFYDESEETLKRIERLRIIDGR